MTGDIRHYILVADEKTWKIALTENLFGFSDASKGPWNTSQVNDFIALYCTKPIQKIIGFGKISNKFISDVPFFPDEILFKRAMYKHRIIFEKLFVVDDWNEGIPPPKNIMLNVARRVIKKELFISLIKSAEKSWKTKIILNPKKRIEQNQ